MSLVGRKRCNFAFVLSKVFIDFSGLIKCDILLFVSLFYNANNRAQNFHVLPVTALNVKRHVLGIIVELYLAVSRL